MTSAAMTGIFSANGPIIERDEVSAAGRLPVSLSVFENMPISITAIIAPADAIATIPKLSISDALLSFFRAETPIARASINGTVTAPVVAPEESKDIARNSFGVK